MSGRKMVALAVVLSLTACSRTTQQRDTQAAAPEMGASPASTAAEQELRRIEEAWDRAVLAHDTRFFERTLSDDFLSQGPGPGTSTKADMIAFAKDTSARWESWSGPVDRVRVFGTSRDVAVVSGHYTYRGRVRGREASARGHYTEVFVEQGGRWVAVAAHYSDLPPLAPSR